MGDNIHVNIDSDTIFLNNRNDNSDSHIRVFTKGGVGENDLDLKSCNVKLDTGFVEAQTMKTTTIKDQNNNDCLTINNDGINFHNRTVSNLNVGLGSLSAASVASANGYASLDAELDALTTNKVSITGHTASKVFVSSSGGGLVTSSVSSSDLAKIGTNESNISTISSNYVSKSADSLIDLATLTVGDDPDGNNGGIQLRRVVNLGLGQVALGKLKLPSITANKVYTFPDDTCTLAKKASVDTNVSSISTNTSSILTNTSNISTNASNISSNTSNITTNASGISTNTTNISTNTSNISTNASGISTNTSTILINASSISTNASGIATNVTNITANTNKLAPITNLNGNIGIGTTTPESLLTIGNHAQTNGTRDLIRFPSYRHNEAFTIRNNDAVGIGRLEFFWGNTTNGSGGHDNTLDKSCLTLKHDGTVGVGETSPAAPLHISYANGNYNNGSQGFINEATSGRSTTRLRSTTNNPCELFFDVNGAARWDFSCRNSNNNYDLMIFKQHANENLGQVSGPVMTLTQTGRLGIGTSTPSAPLHVNGSTTGTSGSGYYISSNSSSLSLDTNWSNDNLSIYASHSIFAAAFSGASDERIKENITEIEDSYSLKKVRDINCVWYNYKDKVSRGNGRVAGFIAQQVREHLPEAVSVTRDFLPNEMRNLKDISWNGTKMSSESLSDVSGIKYRFYVSNDISGNEEMVEIVGNEDNSFTFDSSYNNVFCYGKEVDDFNILDKQKLFALNFSATQELDRKVISLQQENEILKARLTILESKINISA